jgi:radical SAM superfamily enzyme YgiQ (UPF0313 family)
MSDVIIFSGFISGGFSRTVGAYQVANELRRHGYSVQVVEDLPYIAAEGTELLLKLLDKLVDESTLWIGFNTTFFYSLRKESPGQKNSTDNAPFTEREQTEIAEFVRARSPKCRFVIGGAKSFHKNGGSLIDAYIVGYADQSAIEFTKWCQGKNPFFQYKRNPDGSITVDNDQRAASFDFANSRFLWHESDHIFQNEALPIEISRGCIFKCSFCSYPLNGKKKFDYLKNPEILKDQLIENYEKYGTTNYIFSDDTHNDSPEKLEILYDQVYAKLPFKINFGCYLRLDLINAHPHTIQLLKDSGIRTAFFGIESLNYESNKSIGKGLKQEKIIDCLDKIKQHWGDQVYTEGGFIIGLPNDSLESVQQWLKLLENDFSLDSIRLNPLHIGRKKPEMGSLWISDLDLNYTKYGYRFGPQGWVNNRGLTFSQANRLYIECESRFANKLTWTGIFEYMNLGLKFEEVRNFKNDTETRNRYARDRINLLNSYFNKIFNS